MNVARLKPPSRDQVRIAWLAVLLAVLASAYVLRTYAEPQISTATAHAQLLSGLIIHDGRLAAQRSDIAKIQRTLRRNLAPAFLRDRTALHARFVSQIDRLARSRNIKLVAIDSENPTAPSRAPSLRPASRTLNLTSEVVNIRASGHYRNLLRFLEALSKGPMLLRVSDVALTVVQDSSESTEPSLNAKLRLQLYRTSNDDLGRAV